MALEWQTLARWRGLGVCQASGVRVFCWGRRVNGGRECNRPSPSGKMKTAGNPDKALTATSAFRKSPANTIGIACAWKAIAIHSDEKRLIQLCAVSLRRDASPMLMSHSAESARQAASSALASRRITEFTRRLLSPRIHCQPAPKALHLSN